MTTRKPPLSNSDFSAPIGEISVVCCFTLILKGLSISMILYGEFGLSGVSIESVSNSN